MTSHESITRLIYKPIQTGLPPAVAIERTRSGLETSQGRHASRISTLLMQFTRPTDERVNVPSKHIYILSESQLKGYLQIACPRELSFYSLATIFTTTSNRRIDVFLFPSSLPLQSRYAALTIDSSYASPYRSYRANR
ncbi:hypothetical protein V1478_017463 [Vespula squamosa]|uniref:Uncharacterized protein n=1 Tax=Vespula squamosa TaxID=30214 RepID=A0ABD1ZXE0_VESSQ